MAEKRLDMCSGPLLGKMIAFTIPVILTGVLQLFFNAADLIVVGRFCGNDSVAAVGATSAITNLIVNLFVGLSVGAGVTVAQGIGAGDDDAVHKTVHTVIPIAFIGGVVMTIIGVAFSRTFLIWMGTPSDILELSTSYMQIYFGGIIFSMFYNYGSAILRAAGDTKSPLIYLSIAGVMNIILNYIFVITTDLNVAGVALATVISQVFSSALVLRALARRNDACRLDFGKLKIYKAPLVKIIKIGLPAGIQGSIFSISNVLIQSSINSFDSIALVSGNSASHSIEGFVWMAVNAFHQTALNFTGQNYGAGLFKRIKKIMAISLVCVAVTGFVLGGLAALFSRQLLSLYISDSAEAIKWGMVRMSIVSVTYAIGGLMDTSTGAIRGLGASTISMIISIIGVCGMRIGWIYTVFQIPQFHTPQSLYWSYPVSWVVTFVVQLVVFFLIVNKRSREMDSFKEAQEK